jgi:uncharacterized protein YbaR (Trm112 family)
VLDLLELRIMRVLVCPHCAERLVRLKPAAALGKHDAE